MAQRSTGITIPARAASTVPSLSGLDREATPPGRSRRGAHLHGVSRATVGSPDREQSRGARDADGKRRASAPVRWENFDGGLTLRSRSRTATRRTTAVVGALTCALATVVASNSAIMDNKREKVVPPRPLVIDDSSPSGFYA